MFKGYIEGYYSRRLPIDAFKDLKTPISHYFYGPKEDIYLRHRWKELDKNLKRRILPKKIQQVYCVSPTSEFFEDIEKNFESYFMIFDSLKGIFKRVDIHKNPECRICRI